MTGADQRVATLVIGLLQRVRTRPKSHDEGTPEVAGAVCRDEPIALDTLERGTVAAAPAIRVVVGSIAGEVLVPDSSPLKGPRLSSISSSRGDR